MRKDSDFLGMTVPLLLQCPFSHDTLLVLQFLGNKNKSQTKGQELTTDPRTFMVKANFAVKNQAIMAGAKQHRLNEMPRLTGTSVSESEHRKQCIKPRVFTQH